MTDLADLDWTEDGPRSRRFGDVYYSLQDGLAESRAVFLQGCGLPGAWAGRNHFTVGELGFGSGLNIIALLDLWRRESPAGARLSIFSIEAFPMRREDAARALAAWPEIAEPAEALLARWPDLTPGFHRIDLPGFRATLDLAIGDAAWALSQWSGRADAWFLDGFAPAANPAMWSDAVFDGLTAASAPGARAATFTVAGVVRRGLAERGWIVDKRPGFGRKRERLETVRPGAVGAALEPSRIAVIGAGIAGAATARALAALGARPLVVERERPGAGASGFPAALVTPRLDVGDDAIAALGAQSLARAKQLYAQTPGAILTEEVIRLEQAARDAARFDRLAAQPIWPDGAMRRLTAVEVADHLGEPTLQCGGLAMAQGLSVDPAAILDAWLEGCDRIAADVAVLQPHKDGWRLIDAEGGLIIEADAVVLAGGWDGASLLGDASPLSPVRGQASWSQGVAGPAVAWGGYAAPTRMGLLWGATHQRGDVDCGVRAGDDADNLHRLAAVLPNLAGRLRGVEVLSRAAVRATTPDRLPLCGAWGEGIWALGGLGSRGFALAPLLGEHVAAGVMGRPSPLPVCLARRIKPDRFSVTES